MVNREGRRFINEDTYLGFLGDAISHQPDGIAWLLFDSATFWKAMRQMLPNGDDTFLTFKLPALANILFGGSHRAATLEVLAKKCGIESAGVIDAITNFNATIRQGSADVFGKVDAYRHVMGDGPYYAINMSLSNPLATTLTFTLGGLKVDENSGLVLRADGSAVAGLYAAGRTAIGVCSNSYFSGMSLTDCVFSGRRAGKHLAAIHR
jgi:3-oxo-5alpha-steroid 4-dehydrogenase